MIFIMIHIISLLSRLDKIPEWRIQIMNSKACGKNHLQKHPGPEFEFVDLRLNEGNPTQCNRELVGRTVLLVSSFSGARTGAVNGL